MFAKLVQGRLVWSFVGLCRDMPCAPAKWYMTLLGYLHGGVITVVTTLEGQCPNLSGTTQASYLLLPCSHLDRGLAFDIDHWGFIVYCYRYIIWHLAPTGVFCWFWAAALRVLLQWLHQGRARETQEKLQWQLCLCKAEHCIQGQTPSQGLQWDWIS